MRSSNRAQNIIRILDMTYPVTQRFITCILKRSRARHNRNDLGAQELHTENVKLLTLHILFTHEHLAFKAKQRCYRSRGYAMLTGTCLCNNLRFTHTLRKYTLADRIVNFVRACMVKVLTL
ncbi:hypothetical protein D3C78_1217260 [compost metagenome]